MGTTVDMKIKIVDDFNGYEGPSFSNRAEADRALAQRRQQFYAHPGNQHASFRQVIVPADFTWYWSPQQNRFIWG